MDSREEADIAMKGPSARRPGKAAGLTPGLTPGTGRGQRHEDERQEEAQRARGDALGLHDAVEGKLGGELDARRMRKAAHMAREKALADERLEEGGAAEARAADGTGTASPSVPQLVKRFERKIRDVAKEAGAPVSGPASNQADAQEEEEEAKGLGLDEIEEASFAMAEEPSRAEDTAGAVVRVVDEGAEISREPFVWFDAAELGAQDDCGFVPVRESSAALEAMTRARDAIDLQLAKRPVSHRAKATARDRKAQESAKREALVGCADVNELRLLVGSATHKDGAFSLALPEPSDKTSLAACSPLADPAASEESMSAVPGLLRERGVRVNRGARHRAASARALGEATKLAIITRDRLLAAHAALQDPAKWGVYISRVIQAACFADRLAATILADGSLSVMPGFDILARESDPAERARLVGELCDQYDDVEVDVTQGLVEGGATFDTVLRVTGRGLVLVSDAGMLAPEQTLDANTDAVRLWATMTLEIPCSALQGAWARYTSEDCSALADWHARLALEPVDTVASLPVMKKESSGGESKEQLEEEKETAAPFMRRDLPRLAVRPGQTYAYSVQAQSWGKNESGALGIGTSEMAVFTTPLPTPFQGLLELTRIAKLDCGWYHCIALSDMGVVFTWGDNADGELGHGNTDNCDAPRMVEALGGADVPILAVDVASGSDATGSHSACVVRDGGVYVWGHGNASGCGDTKTRTLPQLLDQDDFGGVPVDAIACGASFCAATTCDGKVFTWGLWEHGRLGLGVADVRNQGGRMAGVARRRAARRALSSARAAGDRVSQLRFCTRPRRVEGALADAVVVQVSCGQAHALAVDTRGRLFSWGKGSHGQLGTGALRNALEPRHVQHRIGPGDDDLCALGAVRTTACGANHSMAVLCDGSLATWGGLGAAALGHGGTQTNWSVRVKGSFVVSDKGLKSAARPEVDALNLPAWSTMEQPPQSLEQEQPWRWPRVIQSLDEEIQAVSAGCRHSAALTVSGLALVWGQEHCRGNESCAEPRLLRAPTVLQARSELISCGGWHTAVGTTAPLAASALHEQFRRLTRAANAWEVGADHGVDEAVKPDLKIVVGARVLYAHRVLVAARCPLLRKMIELEAMQGVDEEEEEFAELSLPEMSAAAARALLEFLYGDNLFVRLDPLDTLADELLAVAAEYGLGRLEALCMRALPEPLQSSGARSREEVEALLVDDSTLASTFAADLKAFVNEPQWADVVLETSDEKEVFAHSLILCARCEHFEALLGGGGGGGGDGGDNVRRIKIVDSQAAILRLLTFAYCGALTATREAELFQDLLAAARYGLADMKAHCADAISVQADNALEALAVATRARARSLHERALHVIVANLAELSQAKSFLRLARESPDEIEQILKRAARASAFRTILTESGLAEGAPAEDDPVWLLRRVLRTDEAAEKARLEEETKNAFKNGTTPLQWSLALLAATGVYGYMMAEGALVGLVPYLNGGALVLMALGAGYMIANS